MNDPYSKLKELLSENEWPLNYKFRFIVPANQKEMALKVFHFAQIDFRDSKNGNYLSVHFSLKCDHVDKVIEIYKSASSIPGVISL